MVIEEEMVAGLAPVLVWDPMGVRGQIAGRGYNVQHSALRQRSWRQLRHQGIPQPSGRSSEYVIKLRAGHAVTLSLLQYCICATAGNSISP